MTAMVTMVEGVVPPDRVEDLLEAFPTGELPPYILATTLARMSGSDRWRVVTVWRSRQELDDYIASVDTPAALAAFRAAGVEPEVSMWEPDRVLISGSGADA